MWLTRRNRQSSPRSRRVSLLVEHLERRRAAQRLPLAGRAAELSGRGAGRHVTGRRAAGGRRRSPRCDVAARQRLADRPRGGVPRRRAQRGAGEARAMPLLFSPLQSPTPAGEGYTPAQMRQAYGFNQIALPAGETFDDAGSGPDHRHHRRLRRSLHRLGFADFDETFNIGGAAHDPANTSFFKVVNENGGSTLRPGRQPVDYSLETSLDVEWAHAMAPGANILLVETDSPSAPTTSTPPSNMPPANRASRSSP